MITRIALPASPIEGLSVVSLDMASAPRLQRFFDAIPDYFLAITGKPAQPDDGYQEIIEQPPAGWPFSGLYLLGYQSPSGELAAFANVVSDLLVPRVWHINTFIVETARHGSGDAQLLCQSLEQWAASHGADWIRLGVAHANPRARRFWERQGYQETRLRHGIKIGEQTNTLSVMCKPLSPQATIEGYLSLMARDRPDPE